MGTRWLVCCGQQQSNKKIPSFRCKTAEWSCQKVFSTSTPKPQPTRAASPDGLDSYSHSPTPSPSLLSFPPRSSGSSNCSSSQFIQRGFFWGYVAPYLIWLLSLPVRPSPLLIRQCAVCTFDLDVALALDAPACTHARWAGEVALTKAHR